MSRLSELLTSALPTGWTGNGISRAAQDRGYTLSPTTVLAYVNGAHAQKPSDQVLRAFADVLDVELDELREAAGDPLPSTQYRLPPYADQLTPQARAAVSELVRLLVDSRSASPLTVGARHSGDAPTQEQVDAANAIVGALALAEEMARTQLRDESFARHLVELIGELTATFGRADVDAVEITLPGRQLDDPAPPPPGARQRA